MSKKSGWETYVGTEEKLTGGDNPLLSTEEFRAIQTELAHAKTLMEAQEAEIFNHMHRLLVEGTKQYKEELLATAQEPAVSEYKQQWMPKAAEKAESYVTLLENTVSTNLSADHLTMHSKPQPDLS